MVGFGDNCYPIKVDLEVVMSNGRSKGKVLDYPGRRWSTSGFERWMSSVLEVHFL